MPTRSANYLRLGEGRPEAGAARGCRVPSWRGRGDQVPGAAGPLRRRRQDPGFRGQVGGCAHLHWQAPEEEGWRLLPRD